MRAQRWMQWEVCSTDNMVEDVSMQIKLPRRVVKSFVAVTLKILWLERKEDAVSIMKAGHGFPGETDADVDFKLWVEPGQTGGSNESCNSTEACAVCWWYGGQGGTSGVVLVNIKLRNQKLIRKPGSEMDYDKYCAVCLFLIEKTLEPYLCIKKKIKKQCMLESCVPTWYKPLTVIWEEGTSVEMLPL